MRAQPDRAAPRSSTASAAISHGLAAPRSGDSGRTSIRASRPSSTSTLGMSMPMPRKTGCDSPTSQAPPMAAATATGASGLTRAKSLAPIAAAAVLGGAWLIGLSHPVFLGIGMDMPGVLVLLALLGLMLVRPLAPERGAVRPWLMAALAVLALGAALSGWARLAMPMPADPPAVDGA